MVFNVFVNERFILARRIEVFANRTNKPDSMSRAFAFVSKSWEIIWS